MHPNVLHTITGLNVGGAEVMLARLIGGIEHSRFSSTVLSLLVPGAIAARITEKNSEVLTIGMTTQPKLRDLERLIRSVGQTQPDIVHGWMYHGNLAALLGSMVAARSAPLIWSVHHTIDRLRDENPSTQRIIRFLARLSSRTTAISYCSHVAATHHERLGFDQRRCVVIPNGTDCNEFRPSREAGGRLRQFIGVPASRLIIGHVGRFHPMKDQTGLVRAIGRVLAQGHDVQGVFVGDGHGDGPVRAISRELGIADRITTLGLREDVADITPGFDVFALTSAWGESFSLATGEAMACGVPAVVTTIGDVGRHVGGTGVVVPPGDVEAFAEGLLQIIRLKAEERHALGLKARRWVQQNFSLALYVSRHLDLYERALDQRRSGRRQ